MHTPFRGVEIGERAPRAGEYAGSTKDYTHIRLSFSYLISISVYLTCHDALRFFSAFASVFSPHRTAQNTTAAASKGCEGKNAKVFTPNAQWNNELRKVGEEVEEKNEKWRRRAYARTREAAISTGREPQKTRSPLDGRNTSRRERKMANRKWRADQPSTLLVRGLPSSSSLMLLRVVSAMLWSASSVKKAWWEVSTTLGTMSRRASTSSSIILSLRSS